MSFSFQQTEYGKMESSLSRDRLADICVDKIGVQTGPFGSQLHQEDYVEVGSPIITVEHLGDNRILHENMPCVTDDDKNRLSKYHLKSGDVVFSRVGSVDRRALVRDAEDGWLFSGRCLRVRADKNKIDPVYLSYFFGLETFKNYIRSIAVGATMPSINTKILSDVPIYYPQLDRQKEIANVLYSIDEKIELNRQINQSLEQIAQAIFKSWFVDFDPVKAKILAKEQLKDSLTQTLSHKERVSNLPSPSGRGAGGEGEIAGQKPPIPPKLLEAARELRKNQTDAEHLLWNILRNRQIADYKFRRQHPIGKFILDFYCHERKLAIELDGGQHNEQEQKEYDEARTEWLKEQGVEVLRFWNNEVLKMTEAVVEKIYYSLTQTLSQRERVSNLPSPSGRGAGGEGEESKGLSIVQKALADPMERAAMCAISGKSDADLDQLPAETLKQLAATAALFPDELVESELGLIPKGWEVGAIDEVCHLNMTSWTKKNAPDDV